RGRFDIVCSIRTLHRLALRPLVKSSHPNADAVAFYVRRRLDIRILRKDECRHASCCLHCLGGLVTRRPYWNLLGNPDCFTSSTRSAQGSIGRCQGLSAIRLDHANRAQADTARAKWAPFRRHRKSDPRRAVQRAMITRGLWCVFWLGAFLVQIAHAQTTPGILGIYSTNSAGKVQGGTAFLVSSAG